jgi:transcriptional regulator with XRE-family HTH domain
MDININEIVWKNIKKIRTNKNITQEKLSEMTGLSRTWISQIENWDKSPTLNSLQLISTSLGVSIKVFFN